MSDSCKHVLKPTDKLLNKMHIFYAIGLLDLKPYSYCDTALVTMYFWSLLLAYGWNTQCPVLDNRLDSCETSHLLWMPMTWSKSTTSQQWHSPVIAQPVYTETVKLQLKTRIPNIVLKKPHSNNAHGIFPYLCNINPFTMWNVMHLEALQIQQFVCLKVQCNLGMSWFSI